MTRSLLLLVSLLGVCGCAPPLAERELVAGGNVGSLVAKSDTAVVLLYQPSDSFVCNGTLQPWLAWRQRHPGRVALVFTRPPTRSEQTQLITYRIRPDGILRPGVLGRARRTITPAEIVLVNGRVVATEPVRPGALETPLFRRVAGTVPGR
jgi:hypothetical protein